VLYTGEIDIVVEGEDMHDDFLFDDREMIMTIVRHINGVARH
jgi:hypothetical protein